MPLAPSSCPISTFSHISDIQQFVSFVDPIFLNMICIQRGVMLRLCQCQHQQALLHLHWSWELFWCDVSHLYSQKGTTGWWFQIFFYVHPYLGKITIWTNIFQMGWNHQLDNCWWFSQPDFRWLRWHSWTRCAPGVLSHCWEATHRVTPGVTMNPTSCVWRLDMWSGYYIVVCSGVV